MISFSIEKITDVEEEGAEILSAHMEEVEHSKGGVPNIGIYKAMERTGHLKLIVARNSEDEIIGYAACFLSNDYQYIGRKLCTVDAIYIKPKYRGGATSIKLFRNIQGLCESMGIDESRIGMPIGNLQKRFMNALGYEEMQVMYMRKI